MIRYQIDTTENGYLSYEGSIRVIDELKALLYNNEVFTDCCGYIYTDVAKDASLCVAAVKEHGVFLAYKKEGKPPFERLSLCNRNQLHEVVDVWGDGLDVSEGLFISPELAWEGICEFALRGNMHKDIEWIEVDEIPEDGNYII